MSRPQRTLLAGSLALLLAACGGESQDNSSLVAGGESPTSRSGATSAQLEALGEAFVEARSVPEGPVYRGQAGNARVAKADDPANATVGSWGLVVDWPVIPIHSSLTPDGRVMTFGTTETGAQSAQLNYSVWDPELGTGPDAHLRLANGTGTDIFCGTQILLTDGALQIFGGDVDPVPGRSTNQPNPFVTEFRSQDNSLVKVGEMNRRRWYASSVMMPDGSVLIQGGSGGKDFPEVREPGGAFRLLTTAPTGGLAYGFPRNFLAPDGKVFGFSDSQMYRIDPTGTGHIEMLGTINGSNTGGDSTAALYMPGRVLQVGGGSGQASKQASIIDFSGSTPVQIPLPDMAFGRHWGNATVLADGTVAVTGGSEFNNQMTGVVAYPVELFDPKTNTFTRGPAAQQARLYHSTAVLLPDASLLTGGGGAPGPQTNLNAEIYYPPYLFNPDGSRAIQPTISAAPQIVATGSSFEITVANAADIERLTFIKTSAVTHSVNFDQRLIDLPFTRIGGDKLRVTAPLNGVEAPPGFYMLFAINNAGVPSKARMIKVPVAGNLLQANLLINASFETNVVTAGTTAQVSAPSGWHKGTTPLKIWRNAGGFDPSDGHSFVEIDGAANRADAFGQSASTEPGRLYELRFLYAPRPGTATSTNGVQVLFNGEVLDTLSADGTGTNQPQWHQWAFVVRGTGSDLVQLRETGTDDGQGMFIDDVSLRPRSSAAASLGNGDFENNPLASSNTAAGISVNALPDWHVSTSVSVVRNDPTQPAAQGNSFVVLNTHAVNGQTTPALQQAAGLTAGQRYALTFQLAAPAAQTGGDNRISVRVGDTTLATLQAGNTAWQDYRYEFVAASNDTLAFVAAGSNAGAVAIDAVQLVPIGDALGPVENLSNAPPNITGLGAEAGLLIPTGKVQHFNARMVDPVAGDTYRWTMGDGTVLSTAVPAVAHTYTTPGIYNVRLTVSGPFGTDTHTVQQRVHAPLTSGRPVTSGSIALDTTMNRLWIANPDQNTVTAVDGTQAVRLTEIGVGRHPVAVAMASGNRLLVVSRDDDAVHVIDTSSATLRHTVTLPVGSQPNAIVVDAATDTAWVSAPGRERLLRLTLTPAAEQPPAVAAELAVGPQVRYLGLSGDGATLLASRFITPPADGESTTTVSLADGGEVLMIDTAANRITRTVTLIQDRGPDTEDSARGIPNYLMAPVISPDGLAAVVPFKSDNIFRGLRRDGNSRVFDRLVRSKLARINLATGQEALAARVDFDNNSPATAAAYGPTGNFLFVIHEASRQLQVLDAWGGAPLASLVLGHAPRGLAISADGSRAYVHNWLDRTMSVIDISAVVAGDANQLSVVATVGLTAGERLAANVLRGKQLFHDGQDARLAGQSYLACASCHADGGQDGRTWDFSDGGEGLRNTIDLRGRAGTAHGPVHWTANFDEIHDFENDIRNVFGGSGLLSNSDFAATANTLGAAKAGRSADLDALAAYVTSLNTVGQSPHRNADGSLTAQGSAGRTIFATAGCANCHSGATFTDSPQRRLHDIGTIDAAAGQRLGGALTGFDTPTLRGVWANPPYLHDGSAATLNEAIAAHTSGAVRFDVTRLAHTEIQALVSYLLQIDDREQSAPGSDSDGDGQIDAVDSDDDNDGYADNVDAFPLDPSEWLDTDQDGIGNNRDTDDDNDGVPDDQDSAPLDPTAGAHQCNLLANGDFETGLGQWASAQPLASGAAASGTGAARLSGGWMSQPVPLANATQLVLTARQFSAGSAGWLGAGMDFLDENFDEIGETVTTLDTVSSYTDLRVQARAAIGTRYVRVWFYADGDRSLTLDDIDLRRAGCTDTDGQANQAPVLDNPGQQHHLTSDTVHLQLVAIDPDHDAVQFSARGLPLGLTIDPASGLISGQPGAAGTSHVEITATDGDHPVTVSFYWSVMTPGTASSCNRLLNPGFETGLNDWAHSGSAQLLQGAANVFAGTGAAHISGGWISTEVAIEAGSSWQASARVRTAAGDGWTGVGIDWLDADGIELAETVQTVAPSEDFALTELAATAPAGASRMRLWFYTDATRELSLDALILRPTDCR